MTWRCEGQVNWVATGASLGIIVVFLIAGALWPERSGELFETVQDWVLFNFKWFFVAVVGFTLVFVIWLGFSRYRSVRLGGDDERPEFTYLSWFSMLFAAGMGIGLIFWSIAEPLNHYRSNPFVAEGQSAEAAAAALRLSFFHWGLSAWAIYALVALGLAYFSYRRGLPLTLRSTLHHLIGRRADGWPGDVLDVITVFGTAFGVATSLGLGVQQIEGGLTHLIGPSPGLGRELWVLAAVTVAATVSALSGVRRGVRVISDLNLFLAALLLLFFLVYGPTRHILNVFVQTVGGYVQTLPTLSTWTDANEHSGWQEQWTLFYWAWWIAWSPFVGMFIARISRGRTIGEFVMGVLLVPTILTFAWLAITGGTALYLELFEDRDLLASLDADVTQPLYRTVELLSPGAPGTLAAGLLVVLVTTFFVTSCDSGTLVIASVLSYGVTEPPKAMRFVWGVSEGLLAAVLLAMGGLAALQTAVLVAGLPVAALLLVIIAGLMSALRTETVGPRPGRKTRGDCEPWTGCQRR